MGADFAGVDTFELSAAYICACTLSINPAYLKMLVRYLGREESLVSFRRGRMLAAVTSFNVHTPRTRTAHV